MIKRRNIAMATGSDLPDSDTDLPDTLYHYTDINGLRGIFEDGEIWATNSLFLNDTTELQLGIAVVIAKLAEQLAALWQERAEALRRNVERDKAEREDNAFLPRIAELEQIRDAIDEVGEYSQCYIACLSEKRDQLSQWRGYASGGYCISFHTAPLLESLSTSHRTEHDDQGG
jgi:hypothetical protein